MQEKWRCRLAESFFSLAVITTVAFLCPFIAALVPGKWVQSSALVLIVGAIVGPHMLGLVNPNAEGMQLLKSLGLAFIFLMGGYELSPKDIVGKSGRHAIASWAISFLMAIGTALLVEHFVGDWTQATIVAFAIALSSTSYGKVEADVKNRNLTQTRFAKVVASYGVTGELLPVVATAILISEGAPAIELAIMAFFALLALLAGKFAEHEKNKETKIEQFVETSGNASQMKLQLIIAIMVALVTLGVVLGADMIVAGFAAGYILKRLIPDGGDGNKAFTMLRAVSYGFFIPVAFVLSGCGIDFVAGSREPLVILVFVLLLLVVRGIPVFLGVTLFPGDVHLPLRQRIAVALYSCTTMSTVVAMTSVAVSAGDMTSPIASTLVFAAALISILIPIAERIIEPAEIIRGDKAGIPAKAS